eukprot:3899945-Pyramimonas_sp.AAC.1
MTAALGCAPVQSATPRNDADSDRRPEGSLERLRGAMLTASGCQGVILAAMGNDSVTPQERANPAPAEGAR